MRTTLLFDGQPGFDYFKSQIERLNLETVIGSDRRDNGLIVASVYAGALETMKATNETARHFMFEVVDAEVSEALANARPPYTQS